MLAVSETDRKARFQPPPDERRQHIERMVQEHLLPRYEQGWCFADFNAFLNAHAAVFPPVHRYRFLNSFGLLVEQLGAVEGLDILEAGGESPLTLFLAAHNRCFVTRSDLRYEIDAADASQDLVFSFEVIEHLQDQCTDDIDQAALFRCNSARRYLDEILRVLRPGGALMLTTPNAASYRVIEQAIEGKGPAVFRQHAREYTADELLDLMPGYELAHLEAQTNFFFNQRRKWEPIFEAHGWSTELRGDDLALIARKPAAC